MCSLRLACTVAECLEAAHQMQPRPQAPHMNLGFGINQGGACCVRFHFVKAHRAHILAHRSIWALGCLSACTASASCADPTMSSTSPTRTAHALSGRATCNPLALQAAIGLGRFAPAPCAPMAVPSLDNVRFVPPPLAPQAAIALLLFATRILPARCKLTP